MTARVVLDRTDPWDTVNRIKVECLECHVEWGWSADKRGGGSRGVKRLGAGEGATTATCVSKPL